MNNSTEELDAILGEKIAFFGKAKIVSGADGKFEIVGGTLSDRKQAAAWAARFLDVRFSATEVISG